ncbi:MAG: tRNA pseudouridine synthase A [Phycisphaerales bacterium]
MARFKLTIAYDGTGYHGWQRQEPTLEHAVLTNSERYVDASLVAARPGRVALRTVQAVVERAVREVVREPVEIRGASRTDAGVHARGQVAAFSCSEECWPEARGTEALRRAINSRLPEDVLVVSAERASDGFDPINDCVSKGYTYGLHVSRDRALWDRDNVHHVWVPLDAARMNDAAARLVGEHDFAAFAAAGHGRMTTVRTIFECRVVAGASSDGPVALGTNAESRMPNAEASPSATAPSNAESGISNAVAFPPSRLIIHVSGSGFLWNMVRIIAGTLVEVGRGHMEPEQVSRALMERDRRLAGPTLPATGLCLEWVRYA